ncbi:MAG: CFI-box-CTERM domain-containing protein [Planctomycetota bacterium]|nr:CFI-box-CTERM domain-containing protein [Planctomycetota bacterium]
MIQVFTAKLSSPPQVFLTSQRLSTTPPLRVRYYMWNGRFWVTQLLDSSATVHIGRYVSLVLDDNGLPRMFSYWADGSLKYIRATELGTVEEQPPAPVVDDGETGGGSSGGGCFVATSAFGKYSTHSVRALCAMRDGGFATSATGSTLTSLYYSFSPAIAEQLAFSGGLRAFVRRGLETVR